MSIDIKENNSFIKNWYRPEIDGLRAFAVIAVIINHFNKEILPNGYLGVDIFFVISGFVITSSLYQRRSKSFKDFISGFYERRIKRLVPALSVFVLIISIAVCLFNRYPEDSLKTGLTSLFGLSNLYLINITTDYFAQSTELNVFTHTWSLGVEEQFYILFPFLIWFSGFGRQTKNGARNLFLIVGTLTIVSLIGFLYLYKTNQAAAYFSMPTRFWEIALGCLAFIEFQKKTFIKKLLEKIPPILVIALIIGIMYLPIYMATASTVSVVVLSVVLIASLKKGRSIFVFFTHPKIVYIGLISYSLYLWHWGVLSISRWTIGIHWWSVPFQVALIYFLANTSYQWIETPLRKGSWFGTRWKTLLVGIGVLITISLNLVALGKPLKGKLFSGNKYDKFNIDEVYGETKIINSSTLPTVYLVGDSHAGHYGALMTRLANKKEFNFIMHPRAIGINGPKVDWEEYILAPLRKYKNNFKKGDIIIFSAHIGKYYEKGSDWTKQYTTFIQQTQNTDMKYILISPTPTFSGVPDVFTCLEEWYRPSWAISSLCQINKSDWFLSNNLPISKIEKFLLANPKVAYIDAFSILCPDKYCKNHDQNNLMYKGNHHLNGYGTMKLINTFKTFIQSK